MSSHIDQEEVLIEILKRIPAKLLVKLRCVSKSWYSLITNPTFISIHTKYTLENNTTSTAKNLLLRHYSWTQKKEIYTIHNSSSSFNQENDLFVNFPFKSYCQYFEIVGSCNGLLCLSDTYRIYSHTIILWNPSIRKSVTLPFPCITFDQIYMFVLGFGFDEKRNDYKVVKIVYGARDNGCRVDITPQVEVYELAMNSWRSISVNFAPNYVISELSLQVFLNGFVHWIGYNPSEADGDFRGLSTVLFDISNEVFDEMSLPDSIAGLSVLDLSIAVSANELLSLVQYNRHTRSPWIQYGSCSIWVMKEYGKVESWTKQFTIDLQGGVGKALGLVNNGEMLLVASNGELVSYDIRNKRISCLGIKGITNSFYLETYFETLVLLDGDNGILGDTSSCNATVIHQGEDQEDCIVRKE